MSNVEMREIASLSKNAFNTVIYKIEFYKSEFIPFEALYNRYGQFLVTMTISMDRYLLYYNDKSYAKVGLIELLQNSSISMASI